MQAVLDAERATEVDQVVASLYDGVVCPGDWYDALDASRLALGADSFHLFTLRRRDATVLGPVLSNVVEASAPGGEPLGLLGAMTRGAPVGVPLPSHGPTAVLAIVLRTDEETREVLGFVRDSAGAPWGAASRAVFDCLAPHLVRASGLRAHILHLTGPAAIGLSTLDGLAQGMAVVDEECRVQYLNRAAQACCSEEGGVGRVAHGRLLPAQVPQQPAFRQLVRLACEPSGSATGGPPAAPLSASRPLLRPAFSRSQRASLRRWCRSSPQRLRGVAAPAVPCARSAPCVSRMCSRSGMCSPVAGSTYTASSPKRQAWKRL
jgi:hypothetical protein